MDWTSKRMARPDAGFRPRPTEIAAGPDLWHRHGAQAVEVSMPPLSLPDLLALAFFACAWAGYNLALRHGWGDTSGLNRTMNDYRLRWMLEMSGRESRIVDSGIMASLQNGTAF